MKITLNGKEIELVYSFRINLFYEQISGHSIDFANFTSNDLVNLFYCTVTATLQKLKEESITMMEFLDAIDDNGGEKCVVEFSEWFVDVVKKQYEMLPEDDKKKIDPEGKKKTN